jgi:hypothetical protein
MTHTPVDLTDEQRANLASVHDLLEALQFYADESAWNQPPIKTRAGLLGVEYENQASKVRWDRGRIARAAIAKATGYSSALAALNDETNEMVALSNGRLG